MGRWWGTDKTTRSQTEIDIIADNEQDEAIFAECKWRNEEVGEAELKTLQHRSMLFHYRRKVLMLFSKTGFTDGCVKLAKKWETFIWLNMKRWSFKKDKYGYCTQAMPLS